MSRNLGMLALEYRVYRHIITSVPDLVLYKHPRGWPAIELPNPDATWEAHPVHSKHTYAWIQATYMRFIRGAIVLTEAEVKRVAMLLAGDAYVNAPPPLALPLEPTAKYEPVLEAVVNFMHYTLRIDQKKSYDGPMNSWKGELQKAADRLGLPARSIPADTSWLGRIIRTLSSDLLWCGIRASFYRKEAARFIVLEWTTLPPPPIDGKDGNLTPSTPPTVSQKPLPTSPLGPADVTDGSQAEPDWESLERKGDDAR